MAKEINVRHWADQIADDVIKRINNDKFLKSVVKKTGFFVYDEKTPSGTIHIGSGRGWVIHDAIAKVKLTDYWNPVVSKYNVYASLTGKDEVTTDLDKYVTEKAISGLFTMVKQEEKKIRKDPFVFARA